jgi:hypothetical protein
MTRTIVRLFDRRSDAMEAAHELERMNVRHEDVSIVASNKDSWFGEDAKDGKKDADRDGRDDRAEGAAKGATTGGVLGAGAGLLAGLGLLAIPGLGPVVAAGWLAATATGAAAGAVAGGAVGGIVAALQKEGVSEEDAHVYSEGVRRGGTLLTVRAEDNRASDIEAALDRYNATDVRQRGQEYRSSGWSRFDEAQPPV